jgi:hypothetical protein
VTANLFQQVRHNYGNLSPHRRKVLVADDAMLSESLPPNFPSELAIAVLIARDEVAWPPMLAPKAVEWFGSHGYAALGTELWILKETAIQSLPIGGLSGMWELYGNAVDRKFDEEWSSFVARAAAETRAYLQLFDPSNIVEQGELYFNVVWICEAGYEGLSPKRDFIPPSPRGSASPFRCTLGKVR